VIETCIQRTSRSTGKERDTESGNDYFGARYYASTMGRMLSPDPIVASILSDPTNPQFQGFIQQPQNWNLYAYVLNNPLTYIDPSGMECVWDDGSYDASDDAQTGSASGCSGQGGTWVDPSLFESVEGNQAGSWSGQGSSQIQFDWLTPSATVNGGSGTPLTGTFGPQDFGNMTQGQFISMMQNSGFAVSPLDTALGKTGFGHPGINMRQTVPICSIHVSIKPGTGKNGVPVSGEFHYDLYIPLMSPVPDGAGTETNFTGHITNDVLPDLGQKFGFNNGTGSDECH
jgi:RHS repeat-associated protein